MAAVDEFEAGLRVDEAADQPGAGDAVDMDAAARHPGPVGEIDRFGVSGRFGAADVRMPVALPVQFGKRGFGTPPLRGAEEIEPADILQPLLQPGAVRSARGAGFQQASGDAGDLLIILARSEEHTSELQTLLRTSHAVYCLKKK